MYSSQYYTYEIFHPLSLKIQCSQIVCTPTISCIAHIHMWDKSIVCYLTKKASIRRKLKMKHWNFLQVQSSPNETKLLQSNFGIMWRFITQTKIFKLQFTVYEWLGKYQCIVFCVKGNYSLLTVAPETV